MLKTLLKKQMAEIFRCYFYDAKKNRKRSVASTVFFFAAFVLVMVVILGGSFTALSVKLCKAFVQAGLDWMYFSILGLLAVFLGVFGSVFNTFSGLYLSKDNDLLLSMPIPVRHIITARLLGVYLIGLMYSGVIIIPAIVVYQIYAGLSASDLLGSILFLLLVSLIVLILSCLLGWVVAKISLKLKNKSFITVLLSLAVFALYYFCYYKAQAMITDLIVNAAAYGAQIKGYAYPLYAFGRVGVGSPPAMLAVSASVIALFLLTCYILSHSFLKIATATGKSERLKHRNASVREKSIFAALLGKEFRRFTASPNYMLNCGFGILLLPLLGIAMLWKGNTIILLLQGIFGTKLGFIYVLACATICMVAAMNDMAAPSISLEGKSLWLLQALPVAPRRILHAKLSVQLLLTFIPALFCCICAEIVLPYSALESLLVLLLPLVYVIFSALFSLCVGLKLPNLTWTNELAPIKQGASVMLAVFGGMGYAIVLAGGFLLGGYHMGTIAYLSIFTLLTAVASLLLYLWLRNRGARIFAEL